jgi:hypothetical protein
MKKLTVITMMIVAMLASMPLQAGHRYQGKYDKQWSKQHICKLDHPGRGHKRHARIVQHNDHAHSHYRGHAHGQHHPVARHDDGGHWGIVFRYFD